MMKFKTTALTVLLVVAAVNRSAHLAGAATYPDALGDAKAGAANQGATALDISSISVSFNSTSFLVEMTFNPATPIVPPSSGARNSLIGFIEFDTDRNPSTGAASLNDNFRPFIGHPLVGLGVDGRVDLASEVSHPGLVDVVFGATNVGLVPITYPRNSLLVTFPRSMFANADFVDFAVIIGDQVGPTDAAPTTAGTSSAVPEPATITMLVVGLAVFIGCRRAPAARRGSLTAPAESRRLA